VVGAGGPYMYASIAVHEPRRVAATSLAWSPAITAHMDGRAAWGLPRVPLSASTEGAVSRISKMTIVRFWSPSIAMDDRHGEAKPDEHSSSAQR